MPALSPAEGINAILSSWENGQQRAQQNQQFLWNVELLNQNREREDEVRKIALDQWNKQYKLNEQLNQAQIKAHEATQKKENLEMNAKIAGLINTSAVVPKREQVVTGEHQIPIGIVDPNLIPPEQQPQPQTPKPFSFDDEVNNLVNPPAPQQVDPQANLVRTLSTIDRIAPGQTFGGVEIDPNIALPEEFNATTLKAAMQQLDLENKLRVSAGRNEVGHGRNAVSDEGNWLRFFASQGSDAAGIMKAMIMADARTRADNSNDKASQFANNKVTSLSTAYSRQKEIQQADEVATNLRRVERLRAGIETNPVEAISAIYAYLKSIDPRSVVRQQEIDTLVDFLRSKLGKASVLARSLIMPSNLSHSELKSIANAMIVPLQGMQKDAMQTRAKYIKLVEPHIVKGGFTNEDMDTLIEDKFAGWELDSDNTKYPRRTKSGNKPFKPGAGDVEIP